MCFVGRQPDVFRIEHPEIRAKTGLVLGLVATQSFTRLNHSYSQDIERQTFRVRSPSSDT